MVRKLETHIYLTLELVAIIRNLKFKSTLKSSGRTVALGEGARRGEGGDTRELPILPLQKTSIYNTTFSLHFYIANS